MAIPKTRNVSNDFIQFLVGKRTPVLWQQLANRHPNAQISWGETTWDRKDDVPADEFWVCADHIWAWDRTQYEKDLAHYKAQVKEVEDWAGTRAFPNSVTAPNGMKGKVLWAGGEGIPRFYPEKYPPNWVDYVIEEWSAH